LGGATKPYYDVFTLVTSLEGKNITAIAAGATHSIALDSDGKVYATGENDHDQLGFGDTTDRNVFLKVGF
jgi:alpha-tubulin suppressor-like RCC1 family protein